MKRVLVALALAGLAFGTSAYASNEGPGCGLGTMLFKGQSGTGPHLMAGTTDWVVNGAFSVQEFAMSSGTSGCKTDSVILREKEQEAFVATNLSTLSEEMAQGQGEHVTALASLMGCPAEAYSEFARVSQASYGTVFASAEVKSQEVLASLKSEAGRNPTLAASCSRLA